MARATQNLSLQRAIASCILICRLLNPTVFTPVVNYVCPILQHGGSEDKFISRADRTFPNMRWRCLEHHSVCARTLITKKECSRSGARVYTVKGESQFELRLPEVQRRYTVATKEQSR